jgi:hypothetical protein
LIGKGWDWEKIQKKLRLGFLVCVVLLSSYLGFVTIRTWDEERKEHIAEQRELKARSCNAAEIQRIEPEIKKISSGITNDDSLSTVLEKMKSFSSESSVGISEENIKYQVASFLVKPNCDSSFSFFIEIIFEEGKKVKEFKTWAINPPVGYLYQKTRSNEDEMKWTRILVDELSASYDRFGGHIISKRKKLSDIMRDDNN